MINKQMQRLMMDIVGKIIRNGRQFYGLLTRGDIDPRCSITWIEDHCVVILPDGSAWKFTMAELPVKRKKYIQLTATEITEQWKLATRLQPQNEALMQRQSELTEMIGNLHVLSREREMQNAKMRAHDILGGRLTLLLHTMRSDQTPDYALLRSMSQSLLDDLMEAQSGPEPQDVFDMLKHTFRYIGVEIDITGHLPADNEKGQAFADIAREAIANAVRHGLATQVHIHMDNSDGNYQLKITDNGHPPITFIEGGGIGGMRQKVESFGGTLHIVNTPRFILSVALPGGEI